MTAAIYRDAPPLSIPQTQNTAPVLEFYCLYTHDVRKKAKKWQDGFMRYHTFNKRVMVYDVPRNYIGDMHWTSEEAVQEGDQITLEICAVIVEVGECLGRTETDLTELRQNRKNAAPVSTSSSASPARTGLVHSTSMISSGAAIRRKPPPQMKHRSLNVLLGTPRGPIGKAQLPQRSPFEERQAQVEVENEEWENGRPPKRVKMNTIHARNTPKHTRATTFMDLTEQPLRSPMTHVAKGMTNAAPQSSPIQLRMKELIELSDDDECLGGSNLSPGFTSDLLAGPVSSQRESNKAVQTMRDGSLSPGLQEQRTDHSMQRAAAQDRLKGRSNVSVRGHRSESWDRAVSGPGRAEQVYAAASRSYPGEPRNIGGEATLCGPVSSKAAITSDTSRIQVPRALRLADVTTKRNTLLCQEQLAKQSRRKSSTASVGVPTHTDVESRGSMRKTLDQRLARIDKKRGSTSMARLAYAKVIVPSQTEIEEDLISSAARGGDDTLAVREDEDMDIGSTITRAGQLESQMVSSSLTQQEPIEPPVQRSHAAKPDSNRIPNLASSMDALRQQQPVLDRLVGRPFRRVASDGITQQPTSEEHIIDTAVLRTPTIPPTTTPEALGSALNKMSTSIQARSEKATRNPKAKKPRKALEKAVSLDMTTTGASRVLLNRPFHAPIARENTLPKPSEPPEKLGAWSREAFDLFTWRPPNWNEEKWCVEPEPAV